MRQPQRPQDEAPRPQEVVAGTKVKPICTKYRHLWCTTKAARIACQESITKNVVGAYISSFQ